MVRRPEPADAFFLERIEHGEALRVVDPDHGLARPDGALRAEISQHAAHVHSAYHSSFVDRSGPLITCCRRKPSGLPNR